MIALKVIPQLLAWTALVVVLLRGCELRKSSTAFIAGAGFAGGVAGALFLFSNFSGTLPYQVIKTLLGGSLLLFWGVSLTSLYRSTGGGVAAEPNASGRLRFLCFAAVTFSFALAAGAVCACRLSGGAGEPLPVVAPLLLVLFGFAFIAAGYLLEQFLPPSITVSFSGMFAALVALCLFASSFLVRLDLFSPLSMKVMKGTHDFVHQFMESILIPDHLFVRPRIWGYIGFLFSKEVGFWGGMIIWFTPVLLVLVAIRLKKLPKVSHIRQGAQRRRVIARAMQQRNLRQVIPALSLLVFAGAAYQSLYPAVEYWDPKPVQVSATPAGEILIPKKGELELEDGKLHKFVFKKEGGEARFFVLMTPAGKLSVDLDACSICKPDGYGQAEGTVICFYCKTLIPLETVGKPGGCNPVPLPFTESGNAVRINSTTLVNTWNSTVQSTTAKKGEGK
jgi:hypothetical protein